MLPCIIFSFSSLSLPSSSDSISFPSLPSLSPCVPLYLPSAPPPHQPPPPPLSSLSFRLHTWQRQDPAVNLLKHSHPPSFTSQSWGEGERGSIKKDRGGGRREMGRRRVLVFWGGEQRIHDNKKTNRHKMARNSGGGEGWNRHWWRC